VKYYFVSLGVGVIVGTLYGVLNVRSPAPPVIALIGLAGILIGEQAVPIARHWLARQPVSGALVLSHLRSHSFGRLPTQAPDCQQTATAKRTPERRC
jgi:XapX domain-containing protein